MDVETVLQKVVRAALKDHHFRLPLTIATVAANDAVLFTRFSPAPEGSAAGSVSQVHVTGHVDDEAGFMAPIHMMVRDATGRAKLAVARGTGEPAFVDQPDPSA